MKRDRVEFYRDIKGEFRWRRTNVGNNKEVGAASEGYTRYRAAFSNAYDQFGDTVDYVRWSHEDDVHVPGIFPAIVEMEVDDGSTPED